MIFRQITRKDFPKVRHILQQVVETEEAIVLPHDSSEEEWKNYFFGDETYEVWALEKDGKILGGYHLHPNFKSLGNHIVNGGYIVDSAVRGKGIGTHLGQHSIARARELGYRGIQFNFVISTNKPAVNLWQKLNFNIVGTLPKAFHRKQQDYVDAHVMFLDLTQPPA